MSTSIFVDLIVSVGKLPNDNPLKFVRSIAAILPSHLISVGIMGEEKETIVEIVKRDLRRNQISVFGEFNSGVDLGLKPRQEFRKIAPAYLADLLNPDLYDETAALLITQFEKETEELLTKVGRG